MSEEQTISTLRFASEAKKIQNHAKVNEVLDNQATISRLKKEMEELKRQMELQQSTNMMEMVEEMREQLEMERREKEAQLKLNEELRGKIITSSQPAPPRKSMLPQNTKKSRRETWCGPAMRKNMRMSMATGAFLRPLPKTDFQPPGGFLTPTLSVTQDDFMEHLKSEEEEKLEEVDEEDNETSWSKLEPSPDPVPRRKRKTVNFVHSPQFCSPRRKIRNSLIDLNPTDEGGTPKAVIRDKFKRVSLALTSREVELERERIARLEVESELQELQEFTRLEDESGVTQERKASIDGDVFLEDNSDQVKFLERSFKDAERLNLELKKDLNDKRHELNVLTLKHQELQVSHEVLMEKDKVLEAKVETLEPLATEVKHLKEKSENLERNEQDFEMRLELSVSKKETVIDDLKKCLESAYDEITLLESGNKEDIKKRFQKIADLQDQLSSLQQTVNDNEAFLSEAQKSKQEVENLKEQVSHLSTSLEALAEEKASLKTEVDTLKSTLSETSEVEELKTALEASKRALTEKESVFANMELSNESLLENIDKLNNDFEEVNQKHTNLLVLNKETETINAELKEQINQLKIEVNEAASDKEKFEIENVDMKLEIEEIKSRLTEKESEVAKYGELMQSKEKENDKVKEDLKTTFDEKEELEARLLEMTSSLEKVSHEKTRIENELKELTFVKVNETTNAVSLQDELAAAFGNPLEIETSVMEETQTEEDTNLQDEIDRLKAELLFANQERQKLEVDLSSRPNEVTKSSFLEKLSATLTCIDESFVAPSDADMSTSTLMDESTVNKTISGTGITIETVMEIKNQLLTLQEQIVSFDPEELKVKESQILKLTEEKDELSQKLASLESSPAAAAESSSVHEEYEYRMKEMRSQYQTQLAIMANKMSTETKDNLAALEEKLREEYDVKMTEASRSQSSLHEEYEDKLGDLRKHHLGEMDQLRESLNEESQSKLDILRNEFQEELAKLQECSSKLEGHEDQMKVVQSEHQSLVDGLKEEISRLQSSADSDQVQIKQHLEEEMENLKTQHQEVERNLRQGIARLETDANSFNTTQVESLMAQHKDVEESLRQVIAKLETELSDVRSSSNQEHEKSLEGLKSHHQAIEENLRQEVNELVNQTADLKATLSRDQKELKSLKTEYQNAQDNFQTQITRLEDDFSNTRNSLIQDHAGKLKAVKNQHEVLEEGLRQQISSLEKNVSSIKDSLDHGNQEALANLSAQHKVELETLTVTLVDKFKSEIVEMEAKFKNDLEEKDVEKEKLAKDFDEKLTTLRDDNLAKISQMTSTSEDEKSKLMTQKEELLEEFKAKELKFSKVLENIQQDHEDQVSSLKTSHHAELQALSSNSEEDIQARITTIEERVKDEYSSKENELKDQLGRSQKDFEEAIAELTRDHQDEVDSLSSRLFQETSEKLEVQCKDLQESFRRQLESRELELNKKSELQMDQLREELFKTSEDKENQLSALLKEAESKHLIQLENLKKSHEASITSLNEKEEEFEAKVNLLKKCHEEQLLVVKAKLAEESSSSLEVDQLRKEVSIKEEEVASLSQTLENANGELLRLSEVEQCLREENVNLAKFYDVSKAELQKEIELKVNETSKAQSSLLEVQEQVSRLREVENLLKEENANMKEALEFIEAEKVNKLSESESSLGRLKEALAHKTVEFENLLEKYETEGIALKEKEIELCEEYDDQIEQLKNIHKQEVEAMSSKTREEFLAHITSLESQLSSVDEMKCQLSLHQQFEEQLFMENSKLKEALKSSTESKPSVSLEELEELRRQHEATVTRLKEELGNKNIEVASLRVDVERGELHIKKRCDVLQVNSLFNPIQSY